MPWVTIRTGMKSADGQEQVLKEYLCDWPDCANVAEHVVGIARDNGDGARVLSRTRDAEAPLA
jgi:hypothetical protein